MLDGRVALVTGASRGLGLAIADRLEESGAGVIRWSLRGGRGASAVDVRDRGAVHRALIDIERIDILVNAAGINVRRDFEETTDADWDVVMNTNLRGPFVVTQEAWPALIRARGCVVNIASVAGLWHGPWTVHYAVSKAGLISLTKCLARVGAPHGVRVNAVAPGLCATDQTADEALSDRGRDLVSRTLLGRLIEPREVADAALYLASASAMTGQVLGIHGGAVL